MFRYEVVKTFYELIGPEFQGRDRELGVALASKTAEFIARGAGHSSGAVIALVSLGAAELGIRASLAFNQLLRTTSAWGVPMDATFATEAKTLLSDVIRASDNEVRAVVSRCAAVQHFGDAGRVFDGQMGGVLERSLRKLSAEVDLLVAQAERSSMQGSNSGGNIFNVAGNVGVIQTGAGSMAISSQQIDTGTLDQIRQVLERLGGEVSTLQNNVLPVPKAELLAAIETCKLETRKEQPNGTVLKSLLTGLAGTIGTVASLKVRTRPLKGSLR